MAIILKSEIAKYNKAFADLTLDEGLVTQLLSISESKQRTYINLLNDVCKFNNSHPVLKYIKSVDNLTATYSYMEEHRDTLNNLVEC